ncbi:ligase-associated DNA damage response endonuclease PdeM [Roseomonas sp. OT10]|uniref:ligase-associated DNA damage response endonuclease PdeM n=1 Tax=Roseomonas cutis TaxID=2897332 RepID=UPI001E3F51F3|nr:ligase-associated DNA damage response endonuclease PdeM [Roseomonas sp. OT10]UFN49702.1 ligase-associated DNA damage response endonuclease PdeM [Roseomonas sp. OT10]
MMAAPFHLLGERLMLDPAGVLAWPSRRLLAVADLHLEKGSHFARRGHFVPPYDTRETIARLASALRRHAPKRLLLLGDSFHDAEGSARLSAEDRALLLHALAGVEEVVWVLGNHDPTPPEGLPGVACDEFRDGPLRFRHEADPALHGPGPRRPLHGEVSGHFHPKATMPTRAGGVCRPCFAADAHRLILPSFGAYTGGLNVCDPAIAGLFPRGGRAFLLGRDRVYAMPMAPVRRMARGEIDLTSVT